MSYAKAAVIIGASSAIARACAEALARRGVNLLLAGRDTKDLERDAADLVSRFGIRAQAVHFDADQPAMFSGFVVDVCQAAGDIGWVILALGFMPAEEDSKSNSELAALVLARNFSAPALVLERWAAYLSKRRQGVIVGISSVAGDRGRQSNYLYGSAKAALSTYLQGLRNRLHKSGVRVVTVKPGFVDTAMTFGRPGMFLVAEPHVVGERIIRAAERGENIVYVPWFWRWIMLVIRLIPEELFKRLKL